MNITSIFKRKAETVTACMARHDGGYLVVAGHLVLQRGTLGFAVES